MSAVDAARRIASWVRGNRWRSFCSGTSCPPCKRRVATRRMDSSGLARAHEEQGYRVTCILQRNDDLFLGGVGSILVQLQIGEYCFKSKRHALFHDQAHEQLHALLG